MRRHGPKLISIFFSSHNIFEVVELCWLGDGPKLISIFFSSRNMLEVVELGWAGGRIQVNCATAGSSVFKLDLEWTLFKSFNRLLHQLKCVNRWIGRDGAARLGKSCGLKI